MQKNHRGQKQYNKSTRLIHKIIQLVCKKNIEDKNNTTSRQDLYINYTVSMQKKNHRGQKQYNNSTRLIHKLYS